MNPYHSIVDTPPNDKLRDPDPHAGALRSFGYICLTPAILFALIIIIGGIATHVLEDGPAIPFRMRWPLGLAASLVVFLASSAMMKRPQFQFLMYMSGASTVFCAMIYDTYNTVELNAYDGACGNPAMAGLIFRFACFSTLLGVPLISLAGVVGLSAGELKRRSDEQIGEPEPLITRISKS